MTNLGDAVEKAGSASEAAHDKIKLQRQKLAALPKGHPDRPAQEEKLQSLVELASASDVELTRSMDEEENGGEAYI